MSPRKDTSPRSSPINATEDKEGGGRTALAPIERTPLPLLMITEEEEEDVCDEEAELQEEAEEEENNRQEVNDVDEIAEEMEGCDDEFDPALDEDATSQCEGPCANDRAEESWGECLQPVQKTEAETEARTEMEIETEERIKEHPIEPRQQQLASSGAGGTVAAAQEQPTTPISQEQLDTDAKLSPSAQDIQERGRPGTNVVEEDVEKQENDNKNDAAEQGDRSPAQKPLASLADLPTIPKIGRVKASTGQSMKPQDSPRLMHKPIALLVPKAEQISLPGGSQGQSNTESKDRDKEEKRSKRKKKDKKDKEKKVEEEESVQSERETAIDGSADKENKPIHVGKKGVQFDSVHLIELACYVHSDDICSDGGPAFHLGTEVVSTKKISLSRYEKKRHFSRISFDQYGLKGRVDATTRRSYAFM